ncbi:unnamed protein product [Oppiella nova]|uniref:Uncharacterized protein n=1 Tax=Oppiella nova TaxID=334625 RepID=A0A7R9QUB4_9ACAR|nr:unnamed protein product [Oppiella nova]CAG2174327.1 unnamed protein product [Oppiella nova]
MTDYEGFKQLEVIRISELTRATVRFNYPLGANMLKLINLEEFIKRGRHKAESIIKDIDNNTTLVASADIFNFDTAHFNLLNEFTRKILCEWDYNDNIMMDLLTAITLFNPNRPNIAHRHNVRYLLFKYGSESESKLQKLMFSLQVLQMLSNFELSMKQSIK